MKLGIGVSLLKARNVQRRPTNTTDFFLLQNGDFFLLQTGDKLVLRGEEGSRNLLLQTGFDFLLQDGGLLLL